MCVFVPRSNEIDTFPSENGETPIGVVDRRSYNNNGKPWKSSRILCGKSSKISHSSCFHFFYSFFLFIFSVVRADTKTGNNRREVLVVRFVGLGGQMKLKNPICG